MESTSTVQVKITFNEDLRRFSLPRNATFKQLSETIATVCNISPNVPIVIKYVDCDQDVITMTSDAELREAVAVLGGIMKLQVKALSTPLSGDDGSISGPSLPVRPQVDLYPHLDVQEEQQQAQPTLPLNPRFGLACRGRAHNVRAGFRHHHAHVADMPCITSVPQASAPVSSGVDVGNNNVKPAAPALSKEERVKLREQQVCEWKQKKEEHKAAWKAQWKSLGKEDREKLKEQKKEMRRHWMEERSGFAKCNSSFVVRLVNDVGFADGTEIPPNTPFLKTWKFQNAGQTAWPAGSRLLFVSKNKGNNADHQIQGPESVNLPIQGDVAPGQEIDVSVKLIAPSAPGRYNGFFRLVSPDGVKFGRRFCVSIVVTGTPVSSKAAASRAVISEEEEAKYGALADQIEVMGFNVERKRLVRMLAKHDSDASKVVKKLSRCKDTPKDNLKKECKKRRGDCRQ